MRAPILAVLVAVFLAGAEGRRPRADGRKPHQAPSLTEQVSGTASLLQAVSVVNERVVWVSGHKATYALRPAVGIGARQETACHE